MLKYDFLLFDWDLLGDLIEDIAEKSNFERRMPLISNKEKQRLISSLELYKNYPFEF